MSDDLAKRLGGWTEDATAARYDHAERVEELRAAVEKAKSAERKGERTVETGRESVYLIQMKPACPVHWTEEAKVMHSA